jgi:hypothetical protein
MSRSNVVPPGGNTNLQATCDVVSTVWSEEEAGRVPSPARFLIHLAGEGMLTRSVCGRHRRNYAFWNCMSSQSAALSVMLGVIQLTNAPMLECSVQGWGILPFALHQWKKARILFRCLTLFLPVPLASVDLVSLISSARTVKREGVSVLGSGVGVLSRSLPKGMLDFLLRRVCRLIALRKPSSSAESCCSCSISCKAVTPFVAKFSSATGSKRTTPRFGLISSDSCMKA